MILCQEGYRPGSKIVNALEASILDGVVVSPRYHDPAEVARFVGELRDRGPAAYLVIDPEFHLGAVEGDKVGKLAGYEHYHDQLDWSSFTATRVAQYVREVLSMQMDLPLSRILSPGIPIRALTDWSSSISLSLFDQAITQMGQPAARERLLLTLVLGDEIFRNQDDVDGLLNALTILDCKGFYINVDRQNSADTLWCGPGQDVVLGNFLYLIHVLSMNGFEVICGYSDFTGILMLGAGATGVASGWFKKQRLFDSGRFSPAPPGGRAPKDYYASLPIMNWVPLSPDVDILHRAGVLDLIASGTRYDSLLVDSKRDERWTQEISVHEFWSAMKKADSQLVGATLEGRIAYTRNALAVAEQRWADIRRATHATAALQTTSTNIPCWKTANDHFIKRIEP